MKNNMKLIHGIMFILITMTCTLNAQKMVEIDNQWNIVEYPTFSPNTSSYSVRIGEDTTLNNLSYNKIYHSNDSLNTSWQFRNNYLREDSTKKVFLKEGDAEDILLYDFSLDLNDTFLVETLCTLIVQDVDSVVLNNGEIRKRMKLVLKDEPNWGEEYWIDGIGSNLGVLTHFGFCYTDYPEELLCFYANSELLYPEAPPSCFITPLQEIMQTSFNIFPNPFRDYLSIEHGEVTIQSFTMYDVTGRIVKDGLFDNLNNRINLQGIDHGFYLLILRDNQGLVYAQKLIRDAR